MTQLDQTMDGISEGQRIPEEFAFGVRTRDIPFTFGSNISPTIRWGAGPDGTKSYAIIMHDRSVPTVFDDAN